MAESQPFHIPPYDFPNALPAQSLQYWFDYLQNLKGPNPIQTAFDNDSNQLIPLDPPIVNGQQIPPAPFNGPYPIKICDPQTGRLKQDIGAGVFVGFLLVPGGDDTLAWDPTNWCAVYGKMGKHPNKNWNRSSKAPRIRRRCIFSAKDRNFLGADMRLGTKGRIVTFESIFLIQRLRGQSKSQVEDYVAKAETRARRHGMDEYKAQILHLRSLQNAHLVSLSSLSSKGRLADQYNW